MRSAPSIAMIIDACRRAARQPASITLRPTAIDIFGHYHGAAALDASISVREESMSRDTRVCVIYTQSGFFRIQPTSALDLSLIFDFL